MRQSTFVEQNREGATWDALPLTNMSVAPLLLSRVLYYERVDAPGTPILKLKIYLHPAAARG